MTEGDRKLQDTAAALDEALLHFQETLVTVWERTPADVADVTPELHYATGAMVMILTQLGEASVLAGESLHNLFEPGEDPDPFELRYRPKDGRFEVVEGRTNGT